MKLKLAKFGPSTIVAAAIGLVCLLATAEQYFGAHGGLQRLEWITFDWRARQSLTKPLPIASNLGFVFISDESIDALKNGTLEFRAGLYWPRHVYGRLVRELDAQGARAVGFDVLFADLRPDHPMVQLRSGTETSDAFFAHEMARAGNVVLAAEKGIVPVELFRTNAWAAGDISAVKDADGVLRRARAFEVSYLWHPLIRRAAVRYGFDLRQPQFEKNRISFPIPGASQRRFFQLDSDGNFDWVELYEDLAGEKITGIVKPFQKPYRAIRIWDMGLTVAARQLNLDLENPIIKPGRIILKGPRITRVIPVDSERRFVIDWSITPYDQRLTRESIESLLLQEQNRRHGPYASITNRWRDKLAFIGSTASGGNDLTDLGATPLEREAYLTSRFWNTANSLLMGRFVRTTPFLAQILLVCVMGLIAGGLTQKSRPASAVLWVIFFGVFYIWLSRQVYVSGRIWLPMVGPLTTLGLAHFGLIAHRAFSEQNERRRIKTVFGKIVSPEIMNELLNAENLSLLGARREITVCFADVRGFTKLTDLSQVRAQESVQNRELPDCEIEARLDSHSRDLLRTVNLYLGLIADIVKKHDGTLDKYIGDCVMAFWGAPAANEKHAAACVRAAIESQQAIFVLNQQRRAENQIRERQNEGRLQRGEEPLPALELLSVGIGINTGVVTVGVMGSDAHLYNYTVFGRDVNLASRLEGLSGADRVLIGEVTYSQLRRYDPEVASTCIALEPVTVRGISKPVKIYEVPWRPASIISLAAQSEQQSSNSAEGS